MKKSITICLTALCITLTGCTSNSTSSASSPSQTIPSSENITSSSETSSIISSFEDTYTDEEIEGMKTRVASILDWQALENDETAFKKLFLPYSQGDPKPGVLGGLCAFVQTYGYDFETNSVYPMGEIPSDYQLLEGTEVPVVVMQEFYKETFGATLTASEMRNISENDPDNLSVPAFGRVGGYYAGATNITITPGGAGSCDVTLEEYLFGESSEGFVERGKYHLTFQLVRGEYAIYPHFTSIEEIT